MLENTKLNIKNTFWHMQAEPNGGVARAKSVGQLSSTGGKAENRRARTEMAPAKRAERKRKILKIAF